MSFTVDYKQASQGSLSAGVYKVRFEKHELKTTQDGRQYINCWLRIRKDVQQEYQNHIHFLTIYKFKDKDEWNFYTLNAIAKGLRIPEGKSFNSLGEFLKECAGKVGTVKLTEKNSGERTYLETEWLEDTTPQVENVTVNDDDVPF